jgi:hypothetical protein
MVDTTDTNAQTHAREFTRVFDERMAAAGLGDGLIGEAQHEQAGSILAGVLDLKLEADAHRVLGQAIAVIRAARRSAPTPSEMKEPG